MPTVVVQSRVLVVREQMIASMVMIAFSSLFSPLTASLQPPFLLFTLSTLQRKTSLVEPRLDLLS